VFVNFKIDGLLLLKIYYFKIFISRPYKVYFEVRQHKMTADCKIIFRIIIINK